ncbi:type I-E CRISPR-associated protein Cas5/CasD [Streptomyces sp. NBC_00056]|uniref:type I-E CRISPR-associated protein Cas5/CasD n=1 Tax=Streptomyces sp. NBC_00056 TaxID=2975633 RepID=UPI0032514D15
MPGILLHLAGPLQSWGEHSHFSDRDTLAFPSRSGLTGLLAAALGRRRHEPLDEFAALSTTIRADRPGSRLRDFHTVGGGLNGPRTVATADGGRRSGDTSTLTSTRWYLTDAAFTVALTLTDHTDPPTAWTDALANPRWPLYLGRRSCPPTGPLLLGRSTDALHDLVHLPLAQPHPRTQAGQDTDPNIDVLFLSDQPLNTLPAPQDDPYADTTQEHSTVLDNPVDFTPNHRRYRARPLYRRTVTLPAANCAGYGTQHLQTLTDYASSSFQSAARPAAQGSPQ